MPDLPPPPITSPGPPQWQPTLPPARKRQWLIPLLVVALLATLGVAIAGWLRPAGTRPPAAPTYSNQQVADAKAAVCGAYEQVRKAGDEAGKRDGGNDPTAVLTVATSTRQVLDTSSRYLMTKLDTHPATPHDLAAAVRKLADVYQEMTVDYLDGLTNSDPELSPLLRAGDEAHSTIAGLCK